MKKEFVQIIYLNGPSSSGKTTLAKALKNIFEEPFLHISIDKIIGWMPEKVKDWTGRETPIGDSWKKNVDTYGNSIQELQACPYPQTIGKTFQDVALTLPKIGYHMIVDDVSFGKQQLDEWKKALKDFQVLWFGVNAPLSILEQKKKERGNRVLGSARGQFYKLHVDASYNLEINTHQPRINENADKIKSLGLCPPNLVKHEAKNLIRPMNAKDIAKKVSRYSFPWSTPKKTKALCNTYYKTR